MGDPGENGAQDARRVSYNRKTQLLLLVWGSLLGTQLILINGSLGGEKRASQAKISHRQGQLISTGGKVSRKIRQKPVNMYQL